MEECSTGEEDSVVAQKEKELVATTQHKAWVIDFTEVFVQRKKRVTPTPESHVSLTCLYVFRYLLLFLIILTFLLLLGRIPILLQNFPLLTIRAMIVCPLCFELFQPLLLFPFFAVYLRLYLNLSREEQWKRKCRPLKKYRTWDVVDLLQRNELEGCR